MKNLLITGATGFLGINLLEILNSNFNISVVTRKFKSLQNEKIIQYVVGSFSGNTDFSDALCDIDCVIHAAGIAHESILSEQKNYSIYDEVNVDATRRLAIQASAAGVKRFIFISSIGVLGNQNIKPFSYEDLPNPQENYSISKLKAEMALEEVARNSNMDIIIIRPTLIYGKNAPGNFNKLLRLSKSNLILPFNNIKNQRSFVSVWNLVDLINVCITHVNAPNKVFLVSDDEDVSTSNFLKKMISASSSRTKLITIPKSILMFVFYLLGKKKVFVKLYSSLRVDISHTKETLNWSPPYSLDDCVVMSCKKSSKN